MPALWGNEVIAPEDGEAGVTDGAAAPPLWPGALRPIKYGNADAGEEPNWPVARRPAAVDCPRTSADEGWAADCWADGPAPAEPPPIAPVLPVDADEGVETAEMGVKPAGHG